MRYCDFAGCTFKAKWPCRISKHKLRHSGEKKYECSYKDCESSFITYGELKSHTITHEGNKKYKCTFDGCESSFIRLGGLKNHVLRHECNKKYKCSYKDCESRFITSGGLLDHKLRHEGIKKYKCSYDECESRFVRLCDLKIHIRHHKGDKKYKCIAENCESGFVTLGGLSAHVLRRHKGNKEYKCSYDNCESSFITYDELNSHKITHEGNKKYNCTFDGCESSFIRLRGLYAHIRRHEGDKKYKCTAEKCGSKFITLAELKRHTKIHTATYGQRQKKREQKVADYLVVNEIVHVREQRLEFGKCISTKEGKYCNIDFVLMTDNYLVAVECDEMQHKVYPVSCEVRRMNDAYTSILTSGNSSGNGGVHWIRYNPDSFKVNGVRQHYSTKDRLNKLKETISSLQKNPPNQSFTITYLFYDTTDGTPSVISDSDFPEEFKDVVSCYPSTLRIL